MMELHKKSYLQIHLDNTQHNTHVEHFKHLLILVTNRQYYCFEDGKCKICLGRSCAIIM